MTSTPKKKQVEREKLEQFHGMLQNKMNNESDPDVEIKFIELYIFFMENIYEIDKEMDNKKKREFYNKMMEAKKNGNIDMYKHYYDMYQMYKY